MFIDEPKDKKARTEDENRSRVESQKSGARLVLERMQGTRRPWGSSVDREGQVGWSGEVGRAGRRGQAGRAGEKTRAGRQSR